MTIQTDYYGEIEYEQEDLITVPDGFFGFPELTSFLPLCPSEEDSSMLLIQSVEKPEVAFVVIDPFLLCPDYAPALTPEELHWLDVADPKELSYFVICVLHDNYLDNTVNLKCPFVMNPENRKGMQIILDGSSYGFRHKLGSLPGIIRKPESEDRSCSHAGP